MTEDPTSRVRSEFLARAKQHDPNDMARVIAGLPGQIEFALADPAFPDMDLAHIRRVVVAGMGGSALPTDVVSDVFSDQLDGPIPVARHYRIPFRLEKDTLVIATSFSGTTEETLAAFEQAVHSEATVLAIAAGGTLEERTRNANVPFIRIPKEREPAGFQPRCALGYFTTYITRVLERAQILTNASRTLESAIPFLREVNVRARAEQAAEWLGNRVPIVYTDQVHESSIARIAKIKLNENSKRAAFFNVFPEANHNEMIGLAGRGGEYGLFYVHNPSSHPRVRTRFETMRDVFRARNVSHVAFDMWELPGEDHACRVFAGLTFADWWSYSIALLDGVNPTPVDLVEDFKRTLPQDDSG